MSENHEVVNATIVINSDTSIVCNVNYSDKTTFSVPGSVSLIKSILGHSFKAELKSMRLNFERPNGYIDMAIIDYNNFTIAINVPKVRLPFQYKANGMKTSLEMMVEYPDMVFIYQVIENQVKDSFVFALEEPFEGDLSQQVFNFPFSNNASNTGKICWGNVTSELLTGVTIKSVEYSHLPFLTSEFNGHLSNNQDMILRAKRCQDSFDYTLLGRPIMSLDALLNKHLK